MVKTTNRLSARKPSRDGLPASEYVYRELQRRIASGELEPGTRVVELSVAAQYGVSRTPVREALKRLQAESLIAADPIRGLIVYEPTAREIEDIYLVREALDGLAAQLAAYRVSEGDLARLQLVVDAMREGTADGQAQRLVYANMAFHDIVYAAAGNAMLTQVAQNLRDYIQRFSGEAFASSERVEAVLAEHVQVLDALQRRDASAAEQAAKQHMKRARDYVVGLHVRNSVASQVASPPAAYSNGRARVIVSG